jgi:hypothetical protein
LGLFSFAGKQFVALAVEQKKFSKAIADTPGITHNQIPRMVKGLFYDNDLRGSRDDVFRLLGLEDHIGGKFANYNEKLAAGKVVGLALQADKILRDQVWAGEKLDTAEERAESRKRELMPILLATGGIAGIIGAVIGRATAPKPESTTKAATSTAAKTSLLQGNIGKLALVGGALGLTALLLLR